MPDGRGVTRRAFVGATVLGALSVGSSGASAKTPRAMWRMPEEAGRHTRTFMQWPVNKSVYPDSDFLTALQATIADLANTIAEFEPVVMLMDRGYVSAARQYLSASVEIWNVATDDLWCRDSGPVFVTNGRGRLAVSHLNFNAWGGKQDHQRDAQVARIVAERLEIPVLDNGVVGEAGGVEFDGEHTLIAHESSWVNPNRNVQSRLEIERLMADAFGAEKVVWAPGVRGADITDYHIDALARFIAPGRILIQLPDRPDPADPWARAALKTFDILKKATDARGHRFELTVIPDPLETRVSSEDFVASYVNYYVCNGAVIVAEFGDRDADGAANRILADLYPDREIVALNVDTIGEVGGGIHCATQQQPAV